MRKLVFILIAVIAAATFIRSLALEAPSSATTAIQDLGETAPGARTF